MWRYKNYSISFVEDYRKTIDVIFLKKHWYLDGAINNKSWILTWKVNGEEIWNISIEVKRSDKVGQNGTNIENYQRLLSLRVYFTQTDRNTGESKDFDYNILLATTPCNYWGLRYWFICPCWWNRCGKLYLQNNWYFASRKTLWLKYEDQNQSHRWRYFNKYMWYEYEAEELYKTIKYRWRNGKPTRKYKRYMRLMRYNIPDIERSWAIQNLLPR